MWRRTPRMRPADRSIRRAAGLKDSHDWAFGLEVQVVDFLSGHTVSGALEGFTPGEVTISLSEMISEQREVRVQLNSFVFGGRPVLPTERRPL